MRYLSPADIQDLYRIKKTKAYELLNEYEKQGGEVIRIGTRTRRVEEEPFTEFLKQRTV